MWEAGLRLAWSLHEGELRKCSGYNTLEWFIHFWFQLPFNMPSCAMKSGSLKMTLLRLQYSLDSDCKMGFSTSTWKCVNGGRGHGNHAVAWWAGVWRGGKSLFGGGSSPPEQDASHCWQRLSGSETRSSRRGFLHLPCSCFHLFLSNQFILTCNLHTIQLPDFKVYNS